MFQWFQSTSIFSLHTQNNNKKKSHFDLSDLCQTVQKNKFYLQLNSEIIIHYLNHQESPNYR